MSAIHATQQLFAAYDDRGAWDTGHESAQARFDVEQKMAWGIRLFQGLLGLEGAMQARAMQEPSPE